MKAFLIEFEPSKSQQQPDEPFPLENHALMQNMAFNTNAKNKWTMTDTEKVAQAMTVTQRQGYETK